MTDTLTAPAVRKWTEQDIKAAVWRHYVSRGWAVLTEVSLNGEEGDTRRIDVLCVRRAKRPGIGPIEILAIEVKVTRADFRNDLRHPEKQEPWRALAHRHAYAVPAGLVAPEEVPGGSFLITVDDDTPGWDKITVPKHRLEVKTPVIPPRMFVRMVYQLSNYEGTRLGFNPHTGDTRSPEELLAALDRAENREAIAVAARHRAEARLRTWQTYAAAFTGLPCSTCGEPLVPSRVDGAGYLRVWKHRDKAAAADCDLRREAEAIERARLDAVDAQRRRFGVDRPLPHDWCPPNWFTVPTPTPIDTPEEPPVD